MIAKGQDLDFKTKYETQFLHFDNYKVHYLKRGIGDPILLIHGGGTWMYSWRNMIDNLSATNAVYACDMPGHGYTVTEKEPKYNLDDFSNFIDAFLHHFQIEKITITGNSWGGGWALYYAEKFPDKVDKLVLIDPAGLDVRDVFEWEILKYPLVGELASKMVTRNTVKNAYQKVYFDQTLIDNSIIDQTYKPLKRKQNRRAAYKIERNCNWIITEKQMDNIEIPTKIIWGERDNYLNVKYAKIYSSKIKSSDLTIIENCGHTPQEEKPKETLKIIRYFLTNKNCI